MAFIILSSKGTEIGRRGLTGGVTIGRAPDCDLCVHDILLSRRHCRVEPSGRGWVVLDLRSKNGTWLDGERVGRRSLRHGEVVRAGNTALRFMMGELQAGEGKLRPRKIKTRPADPIEAMVGTVVDFDPRAAEDDPEVSQRRSNSRMPFPRPMPREPVSYAQDGVYSLLEEIASSSWDSIYANASRPTRPMPSAGSEHVLTGVVASRSPIVGAEPALRSVKRPAVPARLQPIYMATAMAPDTLPVRSGSRQVDFSLQAPSVRAPRAMRAPIPDPEPVRAAFQRSQARKSIVRRISHGIGLALASVRCRIAPRGAVMLF